jgi:hypothetical protein
MENLGNGKTDSDSAPEISPELTAEQAARASGMADRFSRIPAKRAAEETANALVRALTGLKRELTEEKAEIALNTLKIWTTGLLSAYDYDYLVSENPDAMTRLDAAVSSIKRRYQLAYGAPAKEAYLIQAPEGDVTVLAAPGSEEEKKIREVQEQALRLQQGGGNGGNGGNGGGNAGLLAAAAAGLIAFMALRG